MTSAEASPDERAEPRAAVTGPSEVADQEPAALDLHEALLKTIAVGVAVANADTWEIEFENGAFFGWFPPDPTREETLRSRLKGLDLEQAERRLEKGRAYRFDVEIGSGARAATVEVQVQLRELEGRQRVLVECRDVTKRKEAEHLLDSYSRMAEKNARELQREKERAERLLLNIMPRSVVDEMKDFGSVAPQRFESASVLLLDFVDFTDMTVAREPGALVSELNDIFSAFDRIVELFGCERMKTIGDAYMAVSGIPDETDDHAEAIARVALRMRRYLEKRNASHPEPWLGRMGIHSGPVVGSIVGVQKYVYDIFGPGVNLASRLEAIADPMQILLSHDTFKSIGEQFILSEQGQVDVKGFGSQQIYSLDGETDLK